MEIMDNHITERQEDRDIILLKGEDEHLGDYVVACHRDDLMERVGCWSKFLAILDGSKNLAPRDVPPGPLPTEVSGFFIPLGTHTMTLGERSDRDSKGYLKVTEEEWEGMIGAEDVVEIRRDSANVKVTVTEDSFWVDFYQKHCDIPLSTRLVEIEEFSRG